MWKLSLRLSFDGWVHEKPQVSTMPSLPLASLAVFLTSFANSITNSSSCSVLTTFIKQINAKNLILNFLFNAKSLCSSPMSCTDCFLPVEKVQKLWRSAWPSPPKVVFVRHFVWYWRKATQQRERDTQHWVLTLNFLN